jgi:hypothetical protein
MIGDTALFIEPYDGEYCIGRIIGEPFPGWFAIRFDYCVGVVPRDRFILCPLS